jgi:endonuclease/exonuclease/phosphatase family metal-dependent hydrolase
MVKAKILLYNVQFAHPTYMINGWRTRLDGIVQHILKNNSYDIVVFTEVFYGKAQQTLLAKLRKVYPYYANSPPGNVFKLKMISAGLLVMSKKPILQHYYEFYDHSKGADQFASKGFLYTQVQIGRGGGNVLNLISTHAQAWEEHMATRILQLKQLNRWIHRQMLFDHIRKPTLVVGDLNMDYHKEHHRETLKHIFGQRTQWPALIGPLKYSCDSKHNTLRGFDGTANSTAYLCAVCATTPNNGLCEMTCRNNHGRIESNQHDSFCPNCPDLLLDYGFVPESCPKFSRKFTVKIRRWRSKKPMNLTLWKFGWVSRPTFRTRDLSDHYPVEIDIECGR